MAGEVSPVELFCSYAFEDEGWLHKLETHLSALKRQGLLSLWHNRLLLPGTDWGCNVDAHLEAASIILLLISADFLASDYCYSIEMKHALERQAMGQAQVVPILVRSADWQRTPFAHLSVLPTNAKPLSAWMDEDAALTDIAVHLRRILENGPRLKTSIIHVASSIILNLPYSRNPFFTGREQILEKLHAVFQSQHTTAFSQAQALSGLGGIGKTQIAIEYAYRYNQQYQTILWVHADTHETLILGYLEIAHQLKLSSKDELDQAHIIWMVLQWLKTETQWLLIFDNAEDLESIHEFIPPIFGGHILLTTRARSVGSLAQRLEVDIMDGDMGALFLLRRAGFIAPEASLETAFSSDVTLAKEITEELGELPLALDQAGAYIEAIPCSLAEYLNLYRGRKIEMLSVRGDLINNHPESVITTWMLSFQRVEQQNPAAADLLRLCAYLAPDAIPETILSQGAQYLGPLLKPITTDAFLMGLAIKVLNTYSLLTRNPQNQSLSMHLLVQEVVRENIGKKAGRIWKRRAIQAINAAFSAVELAQWSARKQYIPHALICATWIEQGQMIMPEAAHLLNLTGSYLRDCGGDARVEAFYKRALTICEQHSGFEHPYRATCLSNLANLYMGEEKYNEAEHLFGQALDIMERQLEQAHPKRISTLSSLASLYIHQNRYTEAESLLKPALAICEHHLGSEHLSTAMIVENIARLCEDQGRYSEAESSLQRALTIKIKHLGLEHPRTASSLNNLAVLYTRLGRYDKAELLFQQSLTIMEQLLEPTHPHMMSSLNNLAYLYQNQGRYTEAESLFKRILKHCEQKFGLKHPNTMSGLDNLALFYARQGKYAEAEPLYQRILTIYK